MDIYKIEALIKTHFNNFLLLVVLLVMLSAATPVSAYDQPWNGNREDITSTTNEPPPSTCPSGNCSCDGTGSPVYLADGSLVWRDTDIRFASSTRVGLKRTYNSFDQRAGLFGRGWVTAQESSIARTYKALDQGNADGSPSTATNFGSVPIWLASYGRRYKLQETATTCTPPGVLYFTFEKQANGNFKQVFEDNQSYSIYDANGKLLQSYSDKEGTSIYYVYDQQNRLIQQYDSYGFTLNFVYNDQGFVSQVADQGNRLWSYTYDGYGRLTQVLDPDGNTKDYGYQFTNNIGYKLHFLNSINDNGNDPVLSVTWANRTIGASTKMRVASYMESDGKSHDYSYLATTYNGSSAVRVIKDTKQVGRNTYIERQTYIADAATYHLLSVVNNTDNTSVVTTFDARGKVTSEKDKRGNVTNYVYNVAGQPTKITELAGTVAAKEINITYWNNSDRVATRNEYGVRETRYTYDASLRVLTKILVDLSNNSQRVTTYTYHPNITDTQGNILLGKMASMNGSQLGAQDTSTFTYNTQGQLNRFNLPQGLSMNYTYNLLGQLSAVTDSNNITTTLNYDSRNRVTQTNHNGRIVKRAFNGQGLLTKIVDPLNRTTNITYNNQNKPTRITYPSGDYLSFTYTYTSSYTEITQQSFQSGGTLISTRVTRNDTNNNQPINTYLASTSQQVSLNQYNSLDELTKKTLNGQFGVNTSSAYTYGYDSEGRTKSIQDVMGTTNFVYNKIGQLTEITDPNNGVTQYQKTAWGETVSLLSPDSGTTTYQVSPSGKISSSINANKQQTIYSYDGLNRRTQVDYEGTGFDTQLTYDEGLNGVGHLTSIVDGSGSTQLQYEDRGLLTHVNAVVAGTALNLSYGYNDAEDLTTVTYPSGAQASYNYDTAGRLSGIQLTLSTTTTDIINAVSWKGSRIGSYQHGNGLQTTFTYDASGRLTEKQFGGVSNRFQNQLDNQSNVISQNWTSNNIQSTNSYEYDQLNRLTKDNDASLNLGLTYGYNSIGNRITKQESTSGESLTYTYEPGSNRLSQINTISVVRDAVGNTLADANRTFSYNVMNRMSQSNNLISNIQGNYTYNYRGQRVRKQLTGGLIDDIRYVYGSTGQLLGEYDLSGNRINEYIYLNNKGSMKLVAKIGGDGTIIYIHSDHLGTPRLASRQDQGIVWSWDSDGFGAIVANEDPDGDGQITIVNHRFEGQYYDEETGLHYNYFRDYDPSTGRYMQSDPIGLNGGLNTYGYVGGNPMQNIDPWGLWSTKAHNYLLKEYGKGNGLNAAQIDSMMQGSSFADSGLHQLAMFAYMHATTSSSITSKAEACKKSNEFINKWLERSKNNTKVKSGGRTNFTHSDPYFQLGVAMHTAMDSTSPAHTGFQNFNFGKIPLHGPDKFGPIQRPGSLEGLSDLLANPGLISDTIGLMNNITNGGTIDCSCY